MEMGKNPKFWVHVRFEFCKRRVRVWFGSGSSLMELERCFPGGRLLLSNNCRYLNLVSQSKVKCLIYCEICLGSCTFLHCALAAAQCIVIGPVCGWVCLFMCVCVCGSVTTITRNCVHRSSPNWVCR